MRTVHGNDAQAMKEVKNIWHGAFKTVALTGAGISTACGVPDFRSPDGLFEMSIKEMLDALHAPLVERRGFDGELVFQPRTKPLLESITATEAQRRSTSIFYRSALSHHGLSAALFRTCALLKEYVYQVVKGASHMHQLLGRRKQEGRLLHWYTQNIDGLESRTGCVLYTGCRGERDRAGASDKPESYDVVQLHGGLNEAVCTKLGHVVPFDHTVSASFLDHTRGDCPRCHQTSSYGRPLEPGSLRPGIVLYDEVTPNASLIKETLVWDARRKPDLLFIAGTSLAVRGAVHLVMDMAPRVRQVKKGRVLMVGWKPPPAPLYGVIDIFVQMDCEEFAKLMWLPESARQPGVGDEDPEREKRELLMQTWL